MTNNKEIALSAALQMHSRTDAQKAEDVVASAELFTKFLDAGPHNTPSGRVFE